MLSCGVDVICIQDTHMSGATSCITDVSFLIILSDGLKDEREHAGVGFLFSLEMRRHIISFNDYTNRLASLLIPVAGGQIAFFSTYAPQGGLDFALRSFLFDELAAFIFENVGDLNAIMHQFSGARPYRRCLASLLACVFLG